MSQGKVNGYVCQGFNPLASVPDKAKLTGRLSQAQVPRHHRPAGDRDLRPSGRTTASSTTSIPSQIQTEVFRLPSSCFAEEDGSLVTSARWLQWHWKAAEPPGEAKGDLEIVAELFLRVRRRSTPRRAGPSPTRSSSCTWPYRIAARALAGGGGQGVQRLRRWPTSPDPKNPTTFLVSEGEQVPGFAVLQADGSHRLRLLDLRRLLDPGRQPDGPARYRRSQRPRHHAGLGLVVAGQPAHPLQPRLLRRRRASRSIPTRKFVCWNGKKWVGNDVPDFKADSAPDERHEPFIMNRRGRGPALGARRMADGPVPRALRALRDAAREEPVLAKVLSNPAARVFKDDWERLRQPEGLPLRRHHLPAHRALPLLDEAHPHRGGPAARGLRRDRRGPGQAAGHPATATRSSSARSAARSR